MTFVYLFFFFKQKPSYEMRISDWSSDVCSSDLIRDMASAPVKSSFLPCRNDDKGRPAASVRSEGPFQCVRQIGSFPGEEVAIGFPATMPISGSRLIDGLVKTKMSRAARRRRRDTLRRNCLNLGLYYRAVAVRVPITRTRRHNPPHN